MSQPFRPKHFFMTLSKDGGAGAFQDWCQFQTVAMESPALFKMEHVETALSLYIYISLALSLPIRRHAQRRLSNSNLYICLQFEDSIPFKVCQHAEAMLVIPVWKKAADHKETTEGQSGLTRRTKWASRSIYMYIQYVAESLYPGTCGKT